MDTEKLAQQTVCRYFWLSSIGATLLSVVLGMIGSFVIPAFLDVFASFGADLPVPTLFMIAARNYLWLATLVATVLWMTWWRYRERIGFRRQILVGFLILGAFDMIVAGAVTWAMYSPQMCSMSVVRLIEPPSGVKIDRSFLL